MSVDTSNPHDLAFITCVEDGFLEEQSLLLYANIRRFGGRYSQAPIYAYCPRAGHSVDAATITAMEALDVIYRDAPLNTEVDYFPYANKNFAAADVERTTAHKILVFLDSDTMFFREPSQFSLPTDIDVRIRPVDLKGICSSGPGDTFDDYWHELAKLCRLDLETLPIIEIPVGKKIRANYNGGLVVARAGLGIFARWEENILAVHKAGLQPRSNDFWGSGQSTLAMAIHAATSNVELLPDSYNYPLHRHDRLLKEKRISSSNEVTHLHYHWMFEQHEWPKSVLAQKDFDWEPEIRDWLFARVPFKASISRSNSML
jgi:hypothetical protein